MTPEHAVAMARYNTWMNRKVYDAAARLDDAERKRDRGAFFRSIHGTLNHLLVGDRIWLGRFTGLDHGIASLDAELYSDFAALRHERERVDGLISDFASDLDPDTLSGDLEFTGITGSAVRRCPLWFALAHLFNHQTHHRGQVSTLLSQAGEDVGITDLSYLPGYTATIE